MTETLSRGAANQAGAHVDADAYAKAADFLPLDGIDHVEFWVGNARQAAAYYRALWGFTPVAFSGLETKVRDRASLRHGPERHPVRLHRPADAGRRDRRARPRARRRRPRHRLRGPGRGGRLAGDDLARRASARSPPTEIDGGEDGVLRRASIHTYGEVLHSFVDRRDYHGVFAPGYRAVKRPPAAAGRAVAARGRPLRRQRRSSARWTASSTSTATSWASPSSSTTTTRSSTPTSAR